MKILKITFELGDKKFETSVSIKEYPLKKGMLRKIIEEMVLIAGSKL